MCANVITINVHAVGACLCVKAHTVLSLDKSVWSACKVFDLSISVCIEVAKL